VTVEIRPIEAEERTDFISALEIAAGRHHNGVAIADGSMPMDLDRTLAAFEDGRIVGGVGSGRLELTVPGAVPVAVARVTLGGVLPTQRRRGVMTEMMTLLLRDVRERGESVAVGATSAPQVIRHWGFAPATLAMGIEVQPHKDAVPQQAGSVGRLRMLERPEMERLLPAVYGRHLRSQSGQISRPDAFWRVWFRDYEWLRIGSSARFAVVFEDANEVAQGYLTYRLDPGSLRTHPVSRLVIEDLITVTDEARRALWHYCLGFEQACTVAAWNLPVDEPLLWMLSDPRRLAVTRLDGFLWLRLNDVAAALKARGYGAFGTIVLDVADPLLGENAGRYRLWVDRGGVECIRTDDMAELGLGVNELAAVYLGGFTFASLARAGRVVELSSGSLARADAFFRPESAPWTVTDW